MKTATCPKCGEECIYHVEVLTSNGYVLEWTCYGCNIDFYAAGIEKDYISKQKERR